MNLWVPWSFGTKKKEEINWFSTFVHFSIAFFPNSFSISNSIIPASSFDHFLCSGEWCWQGVLLNGISYPLIAFNIWYISVVISFHLSVKWRSLPANLTFSISSSLLWMIGCCSDSKLDSVDTAFSVWSEKAVFCAVCPSAWTWQTGSSSFPESAIVGMIFYLIYPELLSFRRLFQSF